MSKSPAILKNAVSVWDALTRAGLDPNGYDREFAEAFAKKLGLGPATSIPRKLRERRPSVAEVLIAFFSSAAPFAGMAHDVWKMFTEADAKFSEQNLQLEFDFGSKKIPGLKFDLEQFKAFHEEFVRLQDEVASPVLTDNYLWKLFNCVRPFVHFDTPKDGELARWVSEYESNRWLKRLPQPALIGDDKVRLCLGELLRVVRSVCEVLNNGGIKPRDRPSPAAYKQESTTALSGDGALLLGFARANHDRWPRSMLVAIHAIAEAHRVNPSDSAVQESIDKLSIELKLDQVAGNNSQLAKTLTEFLNLPLWKYRHQLFGIWTAAQISEAVGYENIEFHPVGGALRFRFKDTHLATVRAEAPIFLFAELRTDARRLVGKGRTNGIQPDWRIVRAPVTEVGSQILIVECKQYMKPSKKNFLEAVVDYAVNTGDAKVILANYGPMDTVRLTKNIPARLKASWRRIKDRVVLLGDFRPDRSGVVQRFHEDVRKALRIESSPVPVPIAAPRPAAKEWSFSLEWSDSDVDLDLHILIPMSDGRSSWVSYASTGDLLVAPWCKLEEDIQSGGSRAEIARIAKPWKGRCEIWVNNYSGSKVFPTPATLTIKREIVLKRIDAPRLEGRAWHIANIDGETRAIAVVNSIHASLPTDPAG